jgi:hypothetical protein
VWRLPHPVGARLAGEGDFKYAFAGKPDSYNDLYSINKLSSLGCSFAL